MTATLAELEEAQAAWIVAAKRNTPGGADFPEHEPGATKRNTDAASAGSFADYVWNVGRFRIARSDQLTDDEKSYLQSWWCGRGKRSEFSATMFNRWTGNGRPVQSITTPDDGPTVEPAVWRPVLDYLELATQAVTELVVEKDPAEAARLRELYPYGEFREIAAALRRAKANHRGGAPQRGAALLRLCRAQRTSELGKFAGYKPRVYVERQAIAEAWNLFVASDARVFAVVGENGRGKSSALCDLVTETLGDQSACLLYNGVYLGPSLLDRIVADLKLTKTGDDRVQRIEFAASQLEHGLTVVLDALNSYTHDHATLRSELETLVASRANLRIVVSCTPVPWRMWSTTGDGNLTPLALNAFVPDKRQRGSGVALPDFIPEELEAAAKLRGIDVKRLSGVWQKACLNPEILDLVASTWDNDTDSLPRQNDLASLLDEIFRKRMPHTFRRALGYVDEWSTQMLEGRALYLPLVDEKLPDELRDVLDQLEAAGIVDVTNDTLRFRDVMADHFIGGRIVWKKLFHGELDEWTTRDYLRNFRDEAWSSPPLGILDAAFLRAEVDLGRNLERLEMCLTELEGWGDAWVAVVGVVAARHPTVHSQRILDMCCSESYLIRESAARGLARAPQLLKKAAESRNWRSRETAAMSFKYRDDNCTDSDCAVLWRLADDSHWRVRRAVGYSAQEYWTKCASHLRDEVLAFLRDSERGWRPGHALLIALAHERVAADLREHLDTVSYHKKCATSANRQLRWLSAYYLPSYPREVYDEVVEHMVKEEDHWIRATFGTALVALATADPSYEDPRRRLGDLCADKHEQETVQIRIARSLALARNADLDGHLELLKRSKKVPVKASAGYFEPVAVPPNDAARLALRIAYADIGASAQRSSAADTFITDHLAIKHVEDPYIHRFETMRALFGPAVEGLATVPESLDVFLRAVLTDVDEGVRWALVLCLAEGSPILTDEHLQMCLEHLVADPHMWVQRELASALPDIVRRRGLPATEARRYLDLMRGSEYMTQDDFADEVTSFLDEAEALLPDAAPPEAANR